MTLPDENVRFDIHLEALAAIKSLQEFMRTTDKAGAQVHSLQEKVIAFSNVVAMQSKRWGVSWQEGLNTFKQLNDQFSRQKQANIFGNVGGRDAFGMSQQYLQALQDADRLHTKAGTSAKQMGDHIESAGRRGARSIDAMRIGLGVIVSMFIFGVFQAVSNFFRMAIDQAKQFETTLYRIANAERQLSMEGVEVSVKGLKKGIEDIKKALPIFSREDIAELVGSLSVTTKELGFNEEQILKLGAAVSILNINSSETESLLQTQAKVTNSLISPQAKSIGALGLSFGKAKLEAKAFEMQLLSAGESFKDLTEKEKTQIKYQIVLETAGIEGVEDLSDLKKIIEESGGDFAALSEYLNTNTARLAENASAWKDLQTTFGQVLLPFVPVATAFFKIIEDGFNMGKVVIIEFMTLLSSLGTAINLVFTGRIKDVDTFTKFLKESADGTREYLVNQFFPEMPTDAPEWFQRGWGDLIKEDAETATDGLQELGETAEEVDFTDFSDKIEDAMQDARDSIAKLAQDYKRKLADLDVEYERKAADAAVDLSRKIEDINRSAERKRAEALAKSREEDLKAERDYLNKLWELRQRFLMDLEEALHARDARQVLRLIKEYNFDKEALARKKKLDDENRKSSLEDDLRQIEIERQRRLADAQLEYQQKLADQRLAKQRELEDLAQWRERELADIETAKQRKLESLIDGWIKEQKITEENAQAVYAILLKYFGPGGMTDSLYSYMMGRLLQVSSAAAQIGGMMGGRVGGIAPPQPTPGSTGGGSRPRNQQGFAEGGTLLATRPTTATFGEDGPEIASFMPLNKIGKDIGKIFGEFSGSKDEMNGQIILDLNLSPDLEARVVNEAMNGTAKIITRINRTKVR